MATRKYNKWKHLQQTPEEEALKVADKVTRQSGNNDRIEASKLVPKYSLPPFEGFSQEDSDKVRDYVAAEFSGYSQQACFEKAGIDVKKGYYFIKTRNRAVEEAREEAAKRCIHRYHQNLWVIRTALTEAGPRAVRTLVDVMDDVKVSAAQRTRAATEILKMLNTSGSASTGKEEIKFEIAGAIRDARAEVKSEKIVDLEAEDAEVVENVD